MRGVTVSSGGQPLRRRTLAGSLAAADRLLAWAEEGLLVLLLAALVFAVDIQVVFRYVLNDPLIWPEETANLTLIWITMIGAGAVTRRGTHIRVDAGIALLPEHWRRIALTIADALVVVVVAALVYYTVITIKLSATMRTATMALPFTVMFFPLLLGGGLILLHTVVGMARRWGAVSGQASQEHEMEVL